MGRWRKFNPGRINARREPKIMTIVLPRVSADLDKQGLKHDGRSDTINLRDAERRRLERFVVWLHGGRPGQVNDLYHTVKSHSVANSGTNSGCNISRDSAACGLYPILEYQFFRNSLLG